MAVTLIGIKAAHLLLIHSWSVYKGSPWRGIRIAGIIDLPIKESERKYHWPPVRQAGPPSEAQ